MPKKLQKTARTNKWIYHDHRVQIQCIKKLSVLLCTCNEYVETKIKMQGYLKSLQKSK